MKFLAMIYNDERLYTKAKTGAMEVRPVLDYEAIMAQAGGAEATAS